MSGSLSPEIAQAFLDFQRSQAQQDLAQQAAQAQAPAQAPSQDQAPVQQSSRPTARTITRDADGNDISDQPKVTHVTDSGGQSQRQTQAQYQAQSQDQSQMMPTPQAQENSYIGNRADVDPNAGAVNGKKVPFYKNQAFYNNLLNFGAATLAASGEAGAGGVPMNGLAAIGKGIQGAVAANQRERELQSQLMQNNSTNSFRNADVSRMNLENELTSQKVNILSNIAARQAGYSGNTNSNNPQFSNALATNSADPNALGDSRLKAAIGNAESGNDYSKENQYGYLGKYQLGQAAMQDAGLYKPADGESVAKAGNSWSGTITIPGFGNMTKQQFLNSPQAQEVAMTAHLHNIANHLDNSGAGQFIGKTINGVEITPASLVSGAHVAGVNGMMNFLNGSNSFKDGNGVNIPTYVNKVNSGIDDDNVSGPNSAPMQAQNANRMQAYGNIVNGMHGNDLDAQINNLSDLATQYSIAGLPTTNINERIKALTDLKYAGPKASAVAQANELAKRQYAVVPTRDAIYVPNGKGGWNVVKNPYQETLVGDDNKLHKYQFTENPVNNPDGSTSVSQTKEDLGVAELPSGYKAQSDKIAEDSAKEVTDAGNAAETAQAAATSANNIRDIITDPDNSDIVGPGAELSNNMRSRIANAMGSIGIHVDPNKLANATIVNQLFMQHMTDVLGHTSHVRTANEYSTIQHGSSNINNPIQALLYNTSLINGKSNDEMNFSRMVANAQTNAVNGGHVFNSSTIKNNYVQSVDPRVLFWDDMIHNNGAYGQQFKAHIFGLPGNQTLRQQRNYRTYLKGQMFLQTDGSKPITDEDVDNMLKARNK